MKTIRNSCLLLFLILTCPGLLRAQATIDSLIERDIASLVTTYKSLHAAPELSHREEKTAALFATELRKLGCAQASLRW